MKKVLPLLVIIILAVAGCQHGPVEYKVAQQPSEVAINAEKFVSQTVKRASHYSAEDWAFAVDQFTAMSKNFMTEKRSMKEEDIYRFDAARLEFLKAVEAHGNEDLVHQIKEVYSNVCN